MIGFDVLSEPGRPARKLTPEARARLAVICAELEAYGRAARARIAVIGDEDDDAEGEE